MNDRWDLGGGCPAVIGGRVSRAAGGWRKDNDNGSQPIASTDGRATVHPALGVVRHRFVGASGVPLAVVVPLGHYRGVAVDIKLDERCCVEAMRLLLSHADPRLEVELARFGDDMDLVAAWRGFARDLGLPMLLRDEAGDQATERRLGSVRLGTPAPRRASRAFLKRRPRLSRRAARAQRSA